MAEALSSLRDRTELQLSIQPGDSYVDGTPELSDVREAYRKTAYKYDIPQLFIKRGIRILANNKKYSLPSNLRKLHYVYVQGVEFDETELNQVHSSRSKYAIDKSTDEIIISSEPSSSATQYTMTNAESAGNSVVIELDSTSGLSVGDEIYLDDATNPEVSYIQSISAGVSITCRLDSSKSASTVLYRGKDIIMIAYYRTVNTLSDAADTTLLPDDFDYYIPFYAAFLAYARLEQYTEAEKSLQYWTEGLKEAFLANDKNSTGFSNQFSV